MRGSVCASPPRGRARGPSGWAQSALPALLFALQPSAQTLLQQLLNWRLLHMPTLPWDSSPSSTGLEEGALFAFFYVKPPRHGPLSLPPSPSGSYQSPLCISSCSSYVAVHNRVGLVLISNCSAILTGCGVKGPFQYLWFADPCIVCPRPHYQNEDLGPQWVNSSNPSLAMTSSNNK